MHLIYRRSSFETFEANINSIQTHRIGLVEFWVVRLLTSKPTFLPSSISGGYTRLRSVRIDERNPRISRMHSYRMPCKSIVYRSTVRYFFGEVCFIRYGVLGRYFMVAQNSTLKKNFDLTVYQHMSKIAWVYWPEYSVQVLVFLSWVSNLHILCIPSHTSKNLHSPPLC